ncbi:MAG: NADH-quinone oxidoreductase subunit B family protein [Candidatus Omnitrophica bacterium]|nr:NADH-quinone oxidoreductase subunit B family protein [Candidatus Omnitrophota bacterium]
MNIKIKALKKSLWVYHMSAGSCNNCDIEILDCLTPKFDIERFGMVLVPSPRHADVLLCTGIGNKKCVERVKEVYKQTAKPCVVVAIGSCACSGGIFRDGYQMAGPLDRIIPVDVYIPGCPPKPEAIIGGIVKLLGKLK